jgi:hypothetical protein
LAAALLAILFSSSFAFIEAHAEGAANGNAHHPDPTKTFTVPARPIGSANAHLQPGMSEKDWHDAYKETGRPKFQLNTVKRRGGTVERD